MVVMVVNRTGLSRCAQALSAASIRLMPEAFSRLKVAALYIAVRLIAFYVTHFTRMLS